MSIPGAVLLLSIGVLLGRLSRWPLGKLALLVVLIALLVNLPAIIGFVQRVVDLARYVRLM